MFVGGVWEREYIILDSLLQQILQMTIVKNLDTGDSFPLSVVDEKIPLGNPLNQHLYRRTAAM